MVEVKVAKEEAHNQTTIMKSVGNQELGIHPDTLRTGQMSTVDKRPNQPQHLTETQWVNQVQAVQSSVVAHPDMQWVSQPKVPIQGGVIANPLLPGFPNQFIGLSAVYIPIQAQGNPSGSVSAPPISQGFVLQPGTGASYVPFGMMYSNQDVNEGAKVERQGTSQDSQPELPNCLAVNSCMVVNPNPPRFIRPASRATSIKGEPGSALESLASAPNSVIVKQTEIIINDPDNNPDQCNDSDPNMFIGSTESSSLYSFLKSSEELYLKNSSSDAGEYVGVSQKETQKQRPTLAQPFWNQRVNITKEMNMNYQMVQEPLQSVLEKDKEKLSIMAQPDLVDEQLGKLFEEFEEGVELEEFLEDFECPPTDTDNSDEASNFELEEKVVRRRRQHLDKMNIFMEAEAPFPLPESMSIKEVSSNFYGCPTYSEKSFGSQKSEMSGSENGYKSENERKPSKKIGLGGSESGSQKSDTQRRPTQKIRFGYTSSLGRLSERSLEDINEDEAFRRGERKEVAVMTKKILDKSSEDQ